MPEFVRSVMLTAEDTTIEPGDWQWAEVSRSLIRLLRSHDLDVSQRTLPPVTGHKGAVTEIIVALGSSGVVGALTTVVLTWLNGQSTRRVKLTVDEGEQARTVEMTAEGLSEASMRAAVLAALGRPDGEPRPEVEAEAEGAGDR